MRAAAALLGLATPVHGQAPPLPAAVPSVRAVRAAEPITLDGRGDEPVWQQTSAVSSFTQVEPSYGQPARFQTAVRVASDDTHLYLYFEAQDPAVREGFRVQDMRRKFD